MSRAEPAQELPELLYAVLDANIFMHFQYVNQIDWPAVLGAKEVCLVCTPMLFQELDDIKDRSTRPGRGELARRVSKTLQEPLEDAPANIAVPFPQRPNTYVMSWEEDDFDIDSRLRRDKRDDHYVASALHFQANNPDDSLVLVAHDFNLQRRAKRFGISARSLPDYLKRALPLTEEEQRLRRLEAVEPKVRIDVEGVAQDEMLLPYAERAQTIRRLRGSYKNEFETLIGALTGKYRYFLQKHGQPERPTPLGNPYEPHSSQRETVLRALRELELSITAELLFPIRTATSDMLRAGVPGHEEYKRQYDEWVALVRKCYDLSAQCVAALATARRDHQYYQLNVACIHTGGAGIQDGKLTVTIEPPYNLANHLPSLTVEPVTYPRPTEIATTVWQSVPESPESQRPSDYEKVYAFGNLHPLKRVTGSSLFIEIVPTYHPSSSPEVTLAIELTGLNVREPIRREIMVALSHDEPLTIMNR